MEENVLEAPPFFKLYNDRAVYVGTFLGGPLVAGYLAGENYRKLGQIQKMKLAWAIAVLTTVILFCIVFYVPDIQRIPRIIIPILYSLAAQFAVRNAQGAQIADHIQKGGAMYSIWRGVWIGILTGAILLGLIFLVFYLMGYEIF